MTRTTTRFRRLRPLAVAALLSVAGAAGAADGATPAVEKVAVRATAQFGFDKTTLLPRDTQRMLDEVHKMTGVTWQAVRAVGHTDSIGSAAYNQKLAGRRAAAVKSFLVGKGLDPAMITTDAKAAEEPAAPNDTPQGRAKNRRAEVEFQGVRAAVAAR